MLLDAVGLRLQGRLLSGTTVVSSDRRGVEPILTRRIREFRRRVWLGLVGMSVVYGVYAAGAVLAYESQESFAYRIVVVFGMVTFPLPLLFASAVFIAALDSLDLYGICESGIRHSQVKLLGSIGCMAWAAAVLGPLAFDRALDAVTHGAIATQREGIVLDANANLTVPLSMALFVFVAGMAGAVVGRLTTALADAPRISARWAAGVILVGLFWTTMVVVAELITMRGILSPIWLALAPPLVPFLLTCALARDDCARIARSLVDRIRHRQDRMEPLVLDDLVTAVQRPDDADPSAAGVRARDHPDPEMAELLARLHRLEGPRGAVDEARVNAIVQALIAVPPPVASGVPQQANAPPASGRLQIAAAAVGCWACLSSALLLLGGAEIEPPTIASASVAGVFGAWATVHIARRDKVNALSSSPV